MDRELAITVIAHTVHEAIRAYQGAIGEPGAPAWDEAGEMQRWSREGVEFALTNPTPGAQHEAWMASMQRDGWTWGPTRDAGQKTHPSLLPFDRLPPSEQDKDAILIAVVGALSTILAVSRR